MNTLPERIEDLDPVIANDLKGCMKKPIPVKATKMYAEFRVQTMEGDYKQGKPGDYLMCGVMGELYICDKEVFEKSYNWLSAS
ncbi:MAG: PGDYG domain-containing protein [Candidatus Thiodiazotropha sp.]